MAKNNIRKFKNFLFLLITIILILVITIIGGEIFCRINYRLKQKFQEQKNKTSDYMDIWRGAELGIGGYLKPNFNSFVIGGHGEKVRWKNNSQGFRYDRDVEFNHDKGVIRVLSLGDSFSAGYRIELRKTFSALLERYFNGKKNGKRYEVLISVINEPFAGLIYLSKFGIKFNPDVVILGITLGNDIVHNYITSTKNDCYIFDKATGTIKENSCLNDKIKEAVFIPGECLVSKNRIPNKIPNNKKSIFNYSMLFNTVSSFFRKYEGEPIISWYDANFGKQSPRMFDICTGFDIYLKNPPIDELPSIFKTLDSYKKLSEENNFKLIIIIFPQRFQVQKEDWIATRNEYNLKEECFDLMKPNNLILNFCRKEKIDCIDPTLQMAVIYKKEGKSLYFPLGDMHWNSLGNWALYESVKKQVYEIINNN